MLISFMQSLSNLVSKALKIMSQIADYFYKQKASSDELAGLSS